MTTATLSTAPADFTTRKGLIARLLDLDASYRQHRALGRATKEQLTDMGMTRADADEVFLGRFADNRWTARERG